MTGEQTPEQVRADRAAAAWESHERACESCAPDLACRQGASLRITAAREAGKAANAAGKAATLEPQSRRGRHVRRRAR